MSISLDGSGGEVLGYIDSKWIKDDCALVTLITEVVLSPIRKRRRKKKENRKKN